MGKGLAIDNRTNVRLLSPCEYAVRHKHAKYDADFRGKSFLFSPVVFETLGAINGRSTYSVPVVPSDVFEVR